MAKILVTGAAGFVGSHTVDQLLVAGHDVVGVDNLRTGRETNLADARTSERFAFEKLDVSQGDDLDRVVADFRPDAIIHLAALVSVAESLENPALNFQLNLLPTHRIAEAARCHRVRRVVFSSSAAVYGDASVLPIEETAPKSPLSPYGAAKLASEAVLLGHGAAFGFTAVCLRYFNVYGPRQDPGSPYSGVISIFCDRLRAGTAPIIFGDGEQTRDFISVQDVARANVLAATLPNLPSNTVNICTGRSTTLNELIAAVSRAHPGAPGPRYGASRAGDIRHSRGSAEQAKQYLRFTAAVKIDDGIAALTGSVECKC